MARHRKAKHDDHVNHEAWVIPYADLLTLLLAFFVVMYAMSSRNEGKYKIMAAALASSFGAEPKSISPIQLGQVQTRGSDFDRPTPALTGSQASPTVSPAVIHTLDRPAGITSAFAKEQETQLSLLSDRIRTAMEELVKQGLVKIRQTPTFLEVEIQSDILFPSGVAVPSALAMSTTREIGKVLRDEPNSIRVEGYTDNVPIRTSQFASNWELSSARAASIVHQLVEGGVNGDRLAIAAFGEYHPISDNATAAGRNSNRRVLLVIMATSAASTGSTGQRTQITEAAILKPAPAHGDSPVRVTAEGDAKALVPAG